MTQFEAFVRKEFFHIFRDTRTLLIIVGMPIVLITLFGFALSLEIRNVNVAIMAKQNDPMINRLADRINRSDCFEVTDVVSSEAAVDSLMRRDVVDAVLMFDSGFSSQLLRDGAKLSVVSDASNPLLAPSEAMYLIHAVNNFFVDEFEGMAQPQAGLTTNVRMLYNPQLKSSYNFVPGVMGLILMIICALMTSVTIVREKESGTMEVLLVSPVRKLTMLVAKMSPYFGRSRAYFGDFVALHNTVFGSWPAGVDIYENATIGHVDLRDGFYSAVDVLVGFGIPDREFSSRIQMDGTDYPGKVVHRSYPQGHDRRRKHNVCLEGHSDNGGHDSDTDRLVIQELQRKVVIGG